MQVSLRGLHLRSSDLDRWMALLQGIQMAPMAASAATARTHKNVSVQNYIEVH